MLHYPSFAFFSMLKHESAMEHLALLWIRQPVPDLAIRCYGLIHRVTNPNSTLPLVNRLQESLDAVCLCMHKRDADPLFGAGPAKHALFLNVADTVYTRSQREVIQCRTLQSGRRLTQRLLPGINQPLPLCQRQGGGEHYYASSLAGMEKHQML